MGIIEDAIKSQKQVEELKKNPNNSSESEKSEDKKNNENVKSPEKEKIQEPIKEFEAPPENNSKKKKAVKKSVSEVTKDDFIKWFYELDKNSGEIAGGKGSNLGEMYNNKIPVPTGFVVTAQAYDYFIEKAGIKEKVKEILDSINYEDTKQLNEATEKIRSLITNSSIPKEMAEEIKEAYEHLDAPESQSSGRSSGGTALDILQSSSEPVFVAVRSSATTEDLENASFAGQQDTYMNVKGDQDLLKHVKKCFASLFTARATYYRNKKGFPHGDSSLAVVVQKMVDSKKSGVSFSKDPTGKTDDVIIEAVWGLGEGIVSGQVTPDKYIVSKSMEIKDKKIAEKKMAITRRASGERAVVKVNEEKSKQQVLTDHEIKRIAEISLRLEDHYQKPQDIEFAIEDEEINIVQTRPVTTIKKSEEDKKTQEEEPEISGEEIISGLGASPGVAVGKVKIIEDLNDLDKIQEGDILVTGMTNPDMVVAMQKASGIVTDEGGMTAHAAIVSREMGIPCIVGTGNATETLAEGDEITVDGNSGKVFKGKIAEETKKEIKPVEVDTKTEIKVLVDLPNFAERAAKTGLKKVGLTRMEGIIAESGKHPQYFVDNQEIENYENVIYKGIKDIAKHFEEIWVRTSDIRSNEYKNLEGAPQKSEENPMLGMHGIRYGLKHPKILKSELRALKRAADDKGTKMGFLLPQVISVEELKEVKKILNEMNFSNIKVGVMIETPASVQIIKSLCEEGIDFVSFGTNDLTQYLLAVDRGNSEVQDLYNEMHPAVTYQLGYVIRVCKRAGVETSICGQAGSKKPMVKYLVKQGIDSISVNADMAAEIADYVSDLEKGKDPYENQEKNLKKETPKEESQKQNQEIQAIEKEKQEYEKSHFESDVSKETGKDEIENQEQSQTQENPTQENKEGYVKGEEAVKRTEEEKEKYGETNDNEKEKQEYENNQNYEEKSGQEDYNGFSQEESRNQEYIKGEEAIEATEKEKQTSEYGGDSSEPKENEQEHENQDYGGQESKNETNEKKDSQGNPLTNEELDELEKQKKEAEKKGQKFSAQTNPPEKVEKNIQALNKEREEYEKSHSELGEEENSEDKEETGPLEENEGHSDNYNEYEEDTEEEDENEEDEEESEEPHYEKPPYEFYHTENLEEEVEDSDFPEESGNEEGENEKEGGMGIFN